MAVRGSAGQTTDGPGTGLQVSCHRRIGAVC
jgi:hypothetical protein